jgi:hypothetical protein
MQKLIPKSLREHAKSVMYNLKISASSKERQAESVMQKQIPKSSKA